MSWTSKLQNVYLHEIYCLNRADLPTERLIGEVLPYFQPSALTDNKKDGYRMDLALDIYNQEMGAVCDCYEEYLPSAKSTTGQIGISKLIFECKDDSRQSSIFNQEINVIFAPLEVVKQSFKANKKNDSWNYVYQSFVGGFYHPSLKTMVIGIHNDIEQLKLTFIHETIHALVDLFPELKETMYGGNSGDQREEICAHVISNNFKQLMSIYNLSFDVKTVVQSDDTDYSAGTLSCSLLTPTLKSVKSSDRELLIDAKLNGTELDKLIGSSNAQNEIVMSW